MAMSKDVCSWGVTLAGGILLSAVQAFAAPVSGAIAEAGTGKPIPGAQVNLIQPTKAQQAEIKYSVDADVHGNYFVADVAPGTYDIAVTSSGYRPTAQTKVQVAADPVKVDLSMQAR